MYVLLFANRRLRIDRVVNIRSGVCKSNIEHCAIELGMELKSELVNPPPLLHVPSRRYDASGL